MGAVATDQEIVELENEFWRAIRDGDTAKASSMVDEDCLITGGQGHSRIDAATFAKLMDTAQWTLHAFTFEKPIVSRPTDDVAVIAYTVTERITIDGQELTIKAADASTWVRRGDEWKCTLHTESIAGDPYGRDRVPSKAANN